MASQNRCFLPEQEIKTKDPLLQEILLSKSLQACRKKQSSHQSLNKAQTFNQQQQNIKTIMLGEKMVSQNQYKFYFIVKNNYVSIFNNKTQYHINQAKTNFSRYFSIQNYYKCVMFSSSSVFQQQSNIKENLQKQVQQFYIYSSSYSNIKNAIFHVLHQDYQRKNQLERQNQQIEESSSQNRKTYNKKLFCQQLDKIVQKNISIIPKYKARLKQLRIKQKIIKEVKSIIQKGEECKLKVIDPQATKDRTYQIQPQFQSTSYNNKQLAKQTKQTKQSRKQRKQSQKNLNIQAPKQQDSKQYIHFISIQEQKQQNNKQSKQFFDKINQHNKYFRFKAFNMKFNLENQTKKHQENVLVLKRTLNLNQQKDPIIRCKSKQKLTREIQILQNLAPHKNLLKYYRQKKQSQQNLGIFMQKMPYCLKVAVQKKQYFFTLKQKLQISIQLIDALNHIHSSGVIHRDIKPENILFQVIENQEIVIKIIDFSDSSRKGQDYSKLIQVLGCTLPYSHIKCLGKNGFNNAKVDFWSVGAVIYWLVFGREPINVKQPYKIFCYQKWEMLFSHQIDLKFKSKNIIEYVIKFICLRLMKINLKDLQMGELQKCKKILKILKSLQVDPYTFLESKQNVQDSQKIIQNPKQRNPGGFQSITIYNKSNFEIQNENQNENELTIKRVMQ